MKRHTRTTFAVTENERRTTMKLEIEVPDGFVTGKLVFIEERNTGIWLDAVNVSTGRVIQVGVPDTEGKRGEQRVPWEAD